MNEEFIAYLSDTLGQTTEAVADLLFTKTDDSQQTDQIAPDAFQRLRELNAQHITKTKGDTKGAFDNGYKKAQSEFLTQYEKELERRGVAKREGAKPWDLLDDLITTAAKPGKINESDIQTHPAYLKRERELAEALEQTKQQAQQQILEIEKGYQRKETLAVVRSKARENLLALNPVLPEEPRIRENLLNVFLKSEFERYDYEMQPNGDILVLEAGQRKNDDHGHPVRFDKLVQTAASQYFQFAKQDPKGQGGNGGSNDQPGTAGGADGVPVMRTEADYIKAMAEASGDQLTKIRAAWKAQQQQ